MPNVNVGSGGAVSGGSARVPSAEEGPGGAAGSGTGTGESANVVVGQGGAVASGDSADIS